MIRHHVVRVHVLTLIQFDNRKGATWHCIVGRNFGSFVTHGRSNDHPSFAASANSLQKLSTSSTSTLDTALSSSSRPSNHEKVD